MHAVVETPSFIADAKTAGLTEDEVRQVVTFLANEPDAGQVIPGTGGARKIRFAGRGKGKSGGYRVITFYADIDLPVFLLNVFAKGDRVDLSQSDRNALRVQLGHLAEDDKSGAI